MVLEEAWISMSAGVKLEEWSWRNGSQGSTELQEQSWRNGAGRVELEMNVAGGKELQMQAELKEGRSNWTGAPAMKD